MNEEEVFNNIKSRIDSINKQVYAEHSIETIVRTKQSVAKISTYEPDIKLLEHRMSKQKPLGKITVDVMKKQDVTTALNIGEDIVPEKIAENEVIGDDETKIEIVLWKNLDIDVKLLKFDEYMTKTEYTNFPEQLQTRLIEMIKDGKLDKKKYINYNEEYARIYDVPIINYDANIQEYYLRCDRENKKKKISKIFK